MANNQNLKPWKPGQSGNPAGKPKGAKHLSTWIQEIMEDESFAYKSNSQKGAPVKAIVTSLIYKALNGDLRAFDLLAKHGYGSKLDITTKDNELPSPIFGGLSVRELRSLSDEKLDILIERAAIGLKENTKQPTV